MALANNDEVVAAKELQTSNQSLQQRTSDLQLAAGDPNRSLQEQIYLLNLCKYYTYTITENNILIQYISATDVTVSPPSVTDTTAINNALSELNVAIKADQTQAAIFQIVTTGIQTATAIQSNVRARSH
jgi:hypothetical protein